MVVTDLLRAGLLALMAVPGMPFSVLCALVVAGQLLAAPFAAARAAILPHVSPGERYVVASAVSGTTYQSGQVLGFALGGPLVALVGVPVALLADAATFVVSALVLQLGVAEQRATAGSPTTRRPRCATAPGSSWATGACAPWSRSPACRRSS